MFISATKEMHYSNECVLGYFAPISLSYLLLKNSHTSLLLQIMSMGAGLCMPQMMFPMGMHRMHPSHVPHFPPMGVGMGMGMGMGMGFGMEMQDINGGSSGYPIYPVPPMQLGHFPHPMSGPTNFHRMPTNFPVYGHPGQGLADSVPRAPLVPSAMGLNSLSNGVPNEAPSTSPVVISKDVNSPLMCNAEAGSSANHKSSEVCAYPLSCTFR